MMYTQLVGFRDYDYMARIAHPEDEAFQLIEASFEFVCNFGSNKVFGKRK